MSHEITFFSAFIAGLISFLSPCVLPLVPAYLSYLAGVQLPGDGEEGEKPRWHMQSLLIAAAFVAGFSTVFILLGATATLLGHWLSAQAFWMTKVAGGVIFVLGLHMIGWIRIPFLMSERRFHASVKRPGMAAAYAVGLMFAFGWTPCVGPLLAGILALAGTRETIMQGIGLLVAYSAGIGLPFLLAALALGKFIDWMRRFKKYMRWMEITAGILLAGIGLMMLLGGMSRLAGALGFLGRFAL